MQQRSFTAGVLAAVVAVTMAQGHGAIPVAQVSQAQPAPATLTPPEGFVLEGMPPIPARIADARAPYAQFRSATFVAWHPVRRELLIGTRFGNTQQIHRVAMPGGARTQLTFLPESLGGGFQATGPAAVFEPKQGRYFVFRRDIEGKANYQNYRFDVDTGLLTRLTDGQSRNTLGVWAKVGDRMAYSSTRRNGKDYDLYVIDPANPASDRLIAQGEGDWAVVGWAPDDRSIVAIESKSAAESYLWRVDVATGGRTALTPPGAQPASYARAAVSRDGRTVYVTTDRDSEFLRLARLDPTTGQIAPLTTNLNFDVEEFALSPDEKLIAFVTNEDGVGVLRLLDLETGKERARPKIPTGLVSNIRWHPNGADLAFDLASARSDRDVYSVSMQTGKVDRWTYSETGGLNPEALVEPELIRWKSFDGLVITGFLYRPPARFGGKRPVMINIHGGPEGQARPSWIGRSNYFLNEMGIAIIYPNVRGSSGSGKKFMNLDNGVLREGAVKDIGALLDWIATRPEFDADRVMVTGASYGGFMTLAVATTYNDRIRCAFAGYGQSNFVTFLEKTHPSRQELRRREYGDERDPETRAFMERIAPLAQAGRLTKPLFIAHDKNDTSVPYEESEQMVAAVRKNGSPLWYLLATNEGHGFTRQTSTEFLLNAWASFMEQYLLK